MISYIVFIFVVRTIKFNRERARPDAAQEDILTTFVTNESTANEIGYRSVTRSECFFDIRTCHFDILVMKHTKRMFLKNKVI